MTIDVEFTENSQSFDAGFQDASGVMFQVGRKTADGGEIFNDYDNNVASAQFAHAEGNATQATARFAHAEGYETQACGLVAHAEGERTTAEGEAAHSEGLDTKALGFCSHAEGERASAEERGAHAEGFGTVAAGRHSHAEGYNTLVYGAGAHGEGYTNKVDEAAKYAHIEGEQGVVSGRGAHVEGGGCQARSNYSHAEGLYTIASGEAQHVSGQYNKEDSSKLVIVGNGTGTTDSLRANAYTLDRKGNGWFAGNVTVGTDKEPLALEKALVAVDAMSTYTAIMTGTLPTAGNDLADKIKNWYNLNLWVPMMVWNAVYEGAITSIQAEQIIG